MVRSPTLASAGFQDPSLTLQLTVTGEGKLAAETKAPAPPCKHTKPFPCPRPPSFLLPDVCPLTVSFRFPQFPSSSLPCPVLSWGLPTLAVFSSYHIPTLKDGGNSAGYVQNPQGPSGLGWVKIFKGHTLETIPPNLHFSPAGLGQLGYKSTAQYPTRCLQGTWPQSTDLDLSPSLGLTSC